MARSRKPTPRGKNSERLTRFSFLNRQTKLIREGSRFSHLGLLRCDDTLLIGGKKPVDAKARKEPTEITSATNRTCNEKRLVPQELQDGLRFVSIHLTTSELQPLNDGSPVSQRTEKVMPPHAV